MFHKNVRRLRLAKHWTQRELALISGVNKRYLQEIEAGRKKPTIVIASKLRTAFRCKWDVLLRGV